MEIFVKNTAYGLIPCMDDDAEKKRTLKVGQIYKCELKGVRNYRFLKKYFALINCTWDCLSDSQKDVYLSPECLRDTLKIACGYCTKVYSIARKEFVEIPKSVSFGSMSEEDFNIFYKQMKEVIFGYVLRATITEEQFNEHLSNF